MLLKEAKTELRTIKTVEKKNEKLLVRLHQVEDGEESRIHKLEQELRALHETNRRQKGTEFELQKTIRMQQAKLEQHMITLDQLGVEGRQIASAAGVQGESKKFMKRYRSMEKECTVLREQLAKVSSEKANFEHLSTTWESKVHRLQKHTKLQEKRHQREIDALKEQLQEASRKYALEKKNRQKYQSEWQRKQDLALLKSPREDGGTPREGGLDMKPIIEDDMHGDM